MNDIGHTRYHFRTCIGAYFGMSTDDARAHLPGHLPPLEKQHSRSVLAVMAFDFDESPVGEYREIVLAVAVPPLVQEGKPLPKSGLYPFRVGTSTEASRRHAIERWHLPHYMGDLTIQFAEERGGLTVRAQDGRRPVLDLTVTPFRFDPSRDLYNAFMVDGAAKFKVNIHMEGSHSVHEEERGKLTLYRHPMTELLAIDEIDPYPFREEWYNHGVQTFGVLETL
jgi:hypothetical protein